MTYFNSEFQIKNINFFNDVLNGMNDWVRVIDRNNNIIYMNKAMSSHIQCISDEPLKCFFLTGRKEPCENCITRMSIFQGGIHQKEEVIRGKVYSIMSSPIYNEQGEAVAAVEVLRDVTEIKELQHQVRAQNQKLTKDLNTAIKLQQGLLPRDFHDDRLSFSYMYKPCESLGGDFLDIFKIGNDHVGFYVADVSGHGVSSSMLTIFLRTSLNRNFLSPSKSLSHLYKKFNKAGLFQDFYITVFYAIIDLTNNTLTYTNAGHSVPPILFNNGSFKLLNSNGIPISNWLPDPGYTDTKVDLSDEDGILLYTDGIVDMRNEYNNFFGEENLMKAIGDGKGHPEKLIQKIVKSVETFSNEVKNSELRDDLTLGIVKLKSREAL